MSVFDLSAPIEPLVGVGPFKLLDNVFSVRRLMLGRFAGTMPDILRQGGWEMALDIPDYIRYSYRDTVHIYSWIYTGLIVQIEVTGAYQGTVQGIGIGSTVRDVQRAFPEVTFDDAIVYVIDLDLHFFIDTDYDFNSLSEVADNRVTAIRIGANHQGLTFNATSLGPTL